MTYAISAHELSDLKSHTSGASSRLVAFIGNTLTFSDRMLDLLSAEFSGYQFIRYKNLTETAIAKRLGISFDLIIFSENQMAEIVKRPDQFLNALDGARFAVGYFNANAASSFLNQTKDVRDLAEVGLLPLNSQIEVWLSVMRLLLCGECYVPQDVFSVLNEEKIKLSSEKTSDCQLTNREWQVLKLVADGVQNKNIAADLSLSVHTVKLHIHNVFKKTGSANRTCAANWFFANGNCNQPSAHPV